MKNLRELKLILIFAILFAIFYFAPVNSSVELASIFLTVSTFIFAILAGFFINRQANRYTSIRNTIANFDGNISALYRSFATLAKAAQKQAGKIIKGHYQKILDEGKWDYHFTHKSTTITDLNNLLAKTVGNKKYSSLKNETINNMLASLDSLQLARKSMVALQVERMPLGEWILILILMVLQLYSLLLIPTESEIFSTILKAFFGTLIIQIVILLHELDSLKLFEKTLGESSARDIINIIEGKR